MPILSITVQWVLTIVHAYVNTTSNKMNFFDVLFWSAVSISYFREILLYYVFEYNICLIIGFSASGMPIILMLDYLYSIFFSFFLVTLTFSIFFTDYLKTLLCVKNFIFGCVSEHSQDILDSPRNHS